MVSLREKAMDYLSRREHSRVELKRKLLQKNFLSSEIDAVLDKLSKDNLQSDDRFAQSYVRYRRQQGFGPLRIALELHERGISENVIDEYVAANSADWKQQLIIVWKKRFSGTQKNQQQQFRFLVQRGFAQEDIYKLFRK